MRNLLIAVFATASVAAVATKDVQHMNVKTGLWEVTNTISRAGKMPITPEMMARLTPQQRAKLEARMKAQSAKNSTTDVHTSCLTKEQLEQGPAFGKETESCTQKVLNSTSTQADVALACEMEGMTANGTLHMEASDPEHVTGTATLTSKGAGQTMDVNSSFTAVWKQASCDEGKK